jgi:hypothetical protein
MPINKNTPTSEIIDDFVHSKNPKFKGKSKAERIKQAVAASYKIHKEESEVDESNNTPYVKAFTEKGQTQQNSWKAMNKHGKVKHFGLDFKDAAMRHAGITEEVEELDEARGRPKKDLGYTVNPNNKEKLYHDNPEHMERIRRLRKNGVLPPEQHAPSEHIINRLRQTTTNQTGGQDIKYENGKTHHVSGSMAAKTLDKYNGMAKPADKEAFQSRIRKSHEEHKSALEEEVMSEEKKLIGKQKKLDKNHNGKLDAEDFKMLRKEELMAQFADALEEGIFDESDIDRLVENELAEMDKSPETKYDRAGQDHAMDKTATPIGAKKFVKDAKAAMNKSFNKEETISESNEPKVTTFAASHRYHAVESAVRDIMSKNQNLKKIDEEETFRRNNPGLFKDK